MRGGVCTPPSPESVLLHPNGWCVGTRPSLVLQMFRNTYKGTNRSLFLGFQQIPREQKLCRIEYQICKSKRYAPY